MKVALAFYGQPRGLDNIDIINQWKHIIDDSTHEIDVYSHFWDTVSNVTVSDTYEEFVEETDVDTSTHFKDFWDILKPKHVEVQNNSVLDQHSFNYFFYNEYIQRRVNRENPSTGRATLGQWYSTENVLKQVNESSVEYDVVVRIRPDVQLLRIYAEHTVFDRHIIEDFYNRKSSNRCIGAPSVKVISGTPIVNDWWTVLEGSFVEEFNYKLTQNMAMQFNSIFIEPDDPVSIQEYALNKHCIKRNIDVISTHCDSKIHRKTNDVWKWPNYST